MGWGLMTFAGKRNSTIRSICSVFLLFDVRVSCSCGRHDVLRADCWKATGPKNLLQELGELAHRS